MDAAARPTGSRAQIRLLYAAGLAQGVALVTFPAAGSIFSSSDGYGLSSAQYGVMFVPQVIAAIVASLSGGAMTRRLGAKGVLVCGLIADLLAMLLLLVSALVVDTVVQSDRGVAYVLLLVATGSLGAGFGLTVPSLTNLVGALRPSSADRAVLVLNALLGLGTALAPAFVIVFVGLGFWWGLPVLTSVVLGGLIVGVARVPFRPPGAAPSTPDIRTRTGSSSGLVVFAAMALLYGIIETMSGNWAQPFMTDDLGASGSIASIALTAFWTAVTAMRIASARIASPTAEGWVYRLAPLLAAAAFFVVPLLRPSSTALAIGVFALSGIGCSVLLPLTLSFGVQRLPGRSATAGVLVAFYQAGYGIAAFGVGYLRDAGIPFAAIFASAGGVAIGASVLAWSITRRRASVSPSA